VIEFPFPFIHGRENQKGFAVRVHLVQMELVWHDRPANHAAARRWLELAKPTPGDLVVLPEMFCVGFSMDVAATHDASGDTETFVRDLARTFGVFLIAGNVTKPDTLGRNEALVADPAGEILGRYHKLHPFRFANEQSHFRGGDGVIAFDWGGVKTSPFVCYDLRFPEVFRLAMKQGAELMVVIANWPTARVAHWLALLTARAIENQAYVVGVNRAGRDPNVEYPGRSVVIDPQGRTIADAGVAAGVVACDLDLAELRAYRTRFPALADVRFI
jgi:predicted amidohydrolase